MEQKAGDKSGELSVKTQDLLEEEVSHGDDDDLSDQLSYGNDDNESGSSIDGNESSNPDISLTREEQGQMTQSHNEYDVDRILLVDDDESVDTEDGDMLSALPRGQFDGEVTHADADGTLQDLLEVYSTRNQISFNQYERSLRQLHSKWESIHDHDMMMLDQERQNMEMHIDDLRRHHEEDLEVTKSEVLEQSQRIIMEEMKANAHRERKNEVDIELAVKEAVQKVKFETERDFQISLAGMKATQADLVKRYEKLIKDAEIRVRHEVEAELKSQYETRTQQLNEEYQEMKQKMIELIMENEKLEISVSEGIGNSKETDDLIALLENEVAVLKNNLMSAKEEISKQNSVPQDQNFVKIAIQNAVQSAEEKFQKDFDLSLDAMMSAQTKLTEKYEKMIYETKASVHDEVYQEAQLQAEKEIRAYKEENDALKKKVGDLSIEVEHLKGDVTNKCSEIDDLRIAMDCKSKELEELSVKLQMKDEIIRSLRSDLEEKTVALNDVSSEIQKITIYDRSVRNDQLRFENDIRSYEKEIEGLRSKLAIQARKHDENTVNAEKHLIDSIEDLKKSHNTEIAQIHAKHTKEVYDLKDMVIALQDERKGYEKNLVEMKNVISTMKRDHQSAISMLEEEHNRESLETLKLIDKLRMEKDDLFMKNSSNAHHSGTSVTSSKKSIKRKKPVIEGIGLQEQLNSLSGSSKSRKTDEIKDHSRDNISNASIGKTTITTRKSMGNDGTPLKGAKEDNIIVEVSPLGMGSPGRPIRTPLSKTAKTPIRQESSSRRNLMRTGDTDQRVRRLRQLDDVPGTADRKIRVRKFNSEVPSSTPKRGTTERRKRGTSKRSVGSPSASVHSLTSTKTPDKNRDISPRRGIFSSTRKTTLALAPAIPLGSAEVRLLILNVPITDRLLMMCSILKIDIVDDPLVATHVIAGDSDHNIRRTAKLMASLCITPYILRSDWLEDSYKGIQILSPSHYLLLNDRIAEKAYGFSMKVTLREGNERRNEGGLLNGWKVLICDGVAGNRAPKEAELHMMIKAAGGKLIHSSDIPIPVEEDPTHVIVLTSDPATPSQLNDEKAQVAAENGGGFFTTSWLFDSMMHQKLFGIKRGLGRL